jgi:hypothetical protein
MLGFKSILLHSCLGKLKSMHHQWIGYELEYFIVHTNECTSSFSWLDNKDETE